MPEWSSTSANLSRRHATPTRIAAMLVAVFVVPHAAAGPVEGAPDVDQVEDLVEDNVDQAVADIVERVMKYVHDVTHANSTDDIVNITEEFVLMTASSLGDNICQLSWDYDFDNPIDVDQHFSEGKLYWRMPLVNVNLEPIVSNHGISWSSNGISCAQEDSAPGSPVPPPPRAETPIPLPDVIRNKVEP